jgi:hypothetical protein
MLHESLKMIADSPGLAWALVVIVAILSGTVIALVSIVARYVAIILRGWPSELQAEDKEDQGNEGGCQ